MLWDMSSTVRAVSFKGVVVVNDRVVLVKNDRDEWELPGGRPEPGETPETTVHREVREELGLDVVVSKSLEDEWSYEVLPGQSVQIRTFGCLPLRTGDPRISDEHIEVGLFAVEDLPSLTMPIGYMRSIEAWFAQLVGRTDTSQ